MQIPNFKRLCLYSLIAILGFLCSNTASAKNSPTLYLDTNQQSGYQVAAIQFLPDYEEYYNKKTTDQNYDSYDKCRQYTLTSCPANGICSTCTFDHSKYRLSSCKAGYKKNSNSSGCLQICGGLSKVLPQGQKCLKAYDGGTACYGDCRAVKCASPYTHNKGDAASLHAATMSQSPTCSSAIESSPTFNSSSNYIMINGEMVSGTWETNCGNACYKIDTCEVGYKLSTDKLSCIPKDDTCPENYYKTCETGTTGTPVQTEAGSLCFQCAPKTKTPQEQCEELGYHTMDYWNEQNPRKNIDIGRFPKTSFNINRNSIIAVLNNLIGIKNAHASYFNTNNDVINTVDGSMKVNTTDKINGGLIPADISKICTTIEDCSKKECANSTLCSANLNGNATIKRDPASMFKTYEFKVTSTCEFDENYVKGSWVEVENDVDDDETDDRTPQQKCEDEGYHNMIYWNKLKPSANGRVGRTSSLEFGSNRFAYLIKNILGIKNAQAANRNTVGIWGEDPVPFVPDCLSVSDCSKPECLSSSICSTVTEFDKTDAVFATKYEFEVSDVCPYDENYVKGSWVAVKKCTENTCSGYTLDECPENGTCSECTQMTTDCVAGSKKYKLTSCAEGYSISEDQTMCIKKITSIPTGTGGGGGGIEYNDTCSDMYISTECIAACRKQVEGGKGTIVPGCSTVNGSPIAPIVPTFDDSIFNQREL